MVLMKKRKYLKTLVILPFWLCFFSSCSDEDEFITFPAGEYLSDCEADAPDSTKTEVTIDRSFRSQTTQTILFAGVTDCSGASVDQGSSGRTGIRFIFSNDDLGNGVSFFTNEVREGGEDVLEYHAFRFQARRLLISDGLRDVEETSLKTEFADFIADPEQHAELFLNRVD